MKLTDAGTFKAYMPLWRVLLLLSLLISWELVGRRNPSLLSHPTLVGRTFVTLATKFGLWSALLFSLRTLLVGWLTASIFGVVVGLALGRVRQLALMFEPFLNALYATPRIALIPLMVLWFGLGNRAIMFTVVLMAFFPVLVMTLTGVRNAGREYVEIARSFCMSERRILFQITLPGALPYIGTGLRLAGGRAVTGMIVGEMFIRGAGLGTMLMDAELALAVDDIFALILLISAVALLVNYAVQLVEKRLQGTRPVGFE